MSDGWEKDPDAVIDFQFQWATWLGAGETIAAATVVAETGLTVGNVTHDTTTVTFRASGGTTNTRYKVTCHVTSSTGEQEDCTRSILVRET